MSSLMPDKCIHLYFHIDTNRINARQKIENMNLLEQWHENGVININMPEPATKELFVENDKRRTNKAVQYIHSYTYADTAEEKERLREIESILFPKGAKNQNEKNDVEIVFNAGKYCGILITNEGASKKQPGGILGNAQRLKKELNISVMRDTDAVCLVREKIEKRDKRARFVAERENLALPEWVGRLA